MEDYDLGVDLGEAVKGHKRVLIQAPDGLKRLALEAAEKLRSAGAEPLLSAGHAWGGCDIAVDEARRVGATLILHIGHHGPVRTRLPEDVEVVFAPAYYRRSPLPAVEAALSLLEGAEKIGLGITVQHARHLDAIEEFLRSNGYTPVAAPGPLGVRGLVIGCDYSALEVEADAYLVVAAGNFHSLGAALWTGGEVVAADPYTGTARRVDGRNVVARHLYGLSKALDAQRILVVVSTKPGQFNLRGALRAAEMLREAGRKVEVAVTGEVTREKLVNMGGFDAYINSACPRLGLDDPGLFPGPVANLGETRYLLSGSLDSWKPRDAFRLHP